MGAEGALLTTLGALLLVGLVANTVGRWVRVPGVTLLLVLGIVIGPGVLDLLPAQRDTWYPLIARVALALVGFLLGHEFQLTELRERGRTVIVGSGLVTIATAFFVALGLLAVGQPVEVAVLLGVIATATDPAATLAVVRELRASGPFSRVLLGVVAIDDVWGLLLFALALPMVGAAVGEGGSGAALLALHELGGGVLLGVLLGAPMALLTGRLRAGEPTRLEALGFVLLCAGLATTFEVSYLMAAIVMGAVVANVARHHEVAFDEIEHVGTPFLVAFFLLAGSSLDVASLAGGGALLAAYVAARVVGRIAGAQVGFALAREPAATRRWMGVALLPQAGVALGLALAVIERFPQHAEPVLNTVIAATVVFELVGPPLTRLALTRMGEARAPD